MRFALLIAAAALVSFDDDRSTIAVADDADVTIQATVYSSENCGPCRLYAADIRREMPPVGWIVREATEPDARGAHIVFQENAAPGIEVYPTTVIRKAGREVDRIVGRITPARLAERIRAHQ